MEARWLLLGLVCSLLAGCWVKEKEIRRKINLIDQETADTGDFFGDDEQDAAQDAEQDDVQDA